METKRKDRAQYHPSGDTKAIAPMVTKKKTRGRVAIDGAIARRHQVMLDEETVRRARALGDGNISLGLRRAVKDAVLEKYIRELRRGRPCAGRWYMLANDGMATLCASEADALAEAADADAAWPRKAPHRAVQLVPADQLAAAVARERDRCALVCEDVRRAVAEINGSGVAAAQQCADAIRAGAKGEPS